MTSSFNPAVRQLPARPSARSSGMLSLMFATSSLALLLVLAWCFFQTSLILGFALPTLFGILPAFLISGLMLMWRLQFSTSTWLICCCITLIDLGFGGLTPVTLGLKFLGYLAALMLGVRAFTTRGRAPLGGATWVFCLYALWACAGVTYSIERFATAYTSFGLFSLAFLTIWCTQLETSDIRPVLRTFASFLGVFMILSGLFTAAFPSLAIATEIAGAGRYSGIFGSPNTSGAVAALTIIINLWRLVDSEERRRGGYGARLLYILAALTMLALSGSRTALVAMVVALAALFAVNLPRVTGVVFVAATTFFVAAEMFGWLDPLIRAATSLISRTRSGSDVSNLTGRLQIWHVVITEWKRSPWIGYGLAGGRTLIAEGWSTGSGKTTGTAHNAVLESLLAVGIVGTVMLFLGFLLSLRDLLFVFRNDTTQRKVVQILLVLLLFIFVFGLTEKSFAGTASLSTGVLALVIGIGATLRRHTRKKQVAAAMAWNANARPAVHF